MEDSDHQIDPVSQSGQNLGSLDVWSPEIWGNLGDFGCYIISFFGKKLGSLDGTYIGIYRGPSATSCRGHTNCLVFSLCSESAPISRAFQIWHWQVLCMQASTCRLLIGVV